MKIIPTQGELNALARAIHERIEKIQSVDNSLETAFSHDPTGLGAQISRRILALRIAYITGRKAVFPNESMYPYETCFLPLGELLGEEVNCQKFDFWEFWDNEKAREEVYRYLPEGCGPGVGIELFFEGALLSQMRLKKTYEDYVNDAKNRLNLHEPYIALHYRRGDKKVETPYVSTERYRNELIKISKETGIKSVFVASDSPDAIRELNLEAAGLLTIFDYDEIRYNNANHRFLMENREKSRQETLTAIKNIYLLAGAEKIVGQTNAHFCTVAASLISYRDRTLFPGILIPGEIELTSRVLSLKYYIKNTAKNIVKKIFPGLTLRGHKRK